LEIMDKVFSSRLDLTNQSNQQSRYWVFHR
jgi:hypothetical protein